MGILDDAIREHLELKRRHGAESDDLERLESEAFGPATRPGDPEYSTGESAAVPEAAAEALDEDEQEAAASGGFFDYGSGAGESSEWAVPEEEATRIVPPETPAEAARTDYPELGETADHPAPPPPPEEAPSDEAPLPIVEPPAPVEEPPAPEAAADPSPSEPPEAPERAIFDSGEIDFGDLDLDLEEEAPPAPVPPAQPPSLSKPLDPVPDVPLADSPFEEDQDDLALETGENESSLADPAAPPPVVDGEEDEEDLLEETPDFLQDAPEGERLWFEQGAPKDFDFDDD